MVKKMLLLMMLSFSLAIGSFWVLRAQDPTTPKPETMKPEPQTPATTTQQVDLSGTYAGTFNCEEVGLVGDTTLTITGNEFTTADGRKGRLTASKTRGYTAVALQVNPADPSMPAAGAKVISLRAKKSGDKLTLTPASGSTVKCSFTPSKNVAKTPSATGTDVANPAATPAQTPSPSPSPTPEASPTPSPTPGESPSPSPTPLPTPSPGEPTPSPTPLPTPSPGEPTPSPTPTPSPSPSPSPGPRLG